LRDLYEDDFRSVGLEYFVTEMQKLHNRVREQLHNRVYQKRREGQFKVGDEFLAHLRKERFPSGTYNKLNMKKIGPCRILGKLAVNAYEIEFLKHVGISSILNVVDLYPYKRDEEGESYDHK